MKVSGRRRRGTGTCLGLEDRPEQIRQKNLLRPGERRDCQACRMYSYRRRRCLRPACLCGERADRSDGGGTGGPSHPWASWMSLTARGLRIFGPSRKAAEIEGSKVLSKEIMKKYGIPSGEFQAFEDYPEAVKYVQGKNTPLVVKADGLRPEKGLFSVKTPTKPSPPWIGS